MNTIIHEIISYQSNIPIKLFYQRIGTVSRHWHSSIEILFVLQGHMTVVIEDQTWELKEDCILLINPHHIHETHSPDCNSSGNASDSSHYFKLKHLIVMLLKNTSTSNEFSQLSNYTCAIEIIRELCLNFRQTAPASGCDENKLPLLNHMMLPFLPTKQNSYLELEHYDFLNKLAPYIRETPVTLSDTDTPVPSEYPTTIQNYADISSVCENPSYFNESFKCFCGVSRASDLLLPAVQEIVCHVQKEIGFKYIKFHGILDDDLMVCQKNTNAKLMFCFTLWI